MIRDNAKQLTTLTINSGIVDEESRAIYEYGFELMLSGIINIILMAIISVMFSRFYDWLLFLSAFIPIRTKAGGYHANSHIKCIAIGTIVFMIFLGIWQLQIEWRVLIIQIAIISLLIIIAISPVEVHNKILKKEHRQKNRVASICIGLVNLLIAIIIYKNYEIMASMNFYFAGVFVATFSMLVAKAIKGKEEKND